MEKGSETNNELSFARGRGTLRFLQRTWDIKNRNNIMGVICMDFRHYAVKRQNVALSRTPKVVIIRFRDLQ